MFKKIVIAIVSITGILAVAIYVFLFMFAIELGGALGDAVGKAKVERLLKQEEEWKRIAPPPPKKASPMWANPREWSRAHCKGPSRSKMCV